MMNKNKTLEYYNKNADNFAKTTIDVNFYETQKHFQELLPEHGYILDFGCGSGRDTKYFLEQGFYVDATDGSEEMCHIASNYTGIQVRRLLFEELDENKKYDGIWACSSILHLPKNELKAVFMKEEFVDEIDNLQLKEEWITGDVRPGRGEEKWLNAILQKN